FSSNNQHTSEFQTTSQSYWTSWARQRGLSSSGSMNKAAPLSTLSRSSPELSRKNLNQSKSWSPPNKQPPKQQATYHSTNQNDFLFPYYGILPKCYWTIPQKRGSPTRGREQVLAKISLRRRRYRLERSFNRASSRFQPVRKC